MVVIKLLAKLSKRVIGVIASGALLTTLSSVSLLRSVLSESVCESSFGEDIQNSLHGEHDNSCPLLVRPVVAAAGG
jgi:hypothetical protein